MQKVVCVCVLHSCPLSCVCVCGVAILLPVYIRKKKKFPRLSQFLHMTFSAAGFLLLQDWQDLRVSHSGACFSGLFPRKRSPNLTAGRTHHTFSYVSLFSFSCRFFVVESTHIHLAVPSDPTVGTQTFI